MSIENLIQQMLILLILMAVGFIAGKAGVIDADGNKKITGILDSFDDDGITIKLTDIKTGKDLNKSLTLSKKEIAKASLAIRFEYK